MFNNSYATMKKPFVCILVHIEIYMHMLIFILYLYLNKILAKRLLVDSSVNKKQQAYKQYV